MKRQKKLNKNEKNFCIDKVNDININKVIDKKNDSTQTNDFKNYKYGNSSRKYKLSRISFSIYSIINNRYNNYKDNDNDNNLFTYNGNNQIKNNLYNNKIRLNYYPKQTVSFVKKRKESDQNNNNNQQRYIKKYNNAAFDYDEIQTNKSYNLEKSPNFKSNLYSSSFSFFFIAELSLISTLATHKQLSNIKYSPIDLSIVYSLLDLSIVPFITSIRK